MYISQQQRQQRSIAKGPKGSTGVFLLLCLKGGCFSEGEKCSCYAITLHRFCSQAYLGSWLARLMCKLEPDVSQTRE